MAQTGIDVLALKAEILEAIRSAGIWQPEAEVGAAAENGHIPVTIRGQAARFYQLQMAQEAVFALAKARGIFIDIVNRVQVD